MKIFLKKIKKHMEIARSKGPAWFYYKYIYARNIIMTPPVACDEEGRFELHTLACERDFLNTLWSLKTFYYFSGARPRLVVYDDGSLSKASIKIFREHFMHCQIISRDTFNRDMEDFLKAYRMSLKYCKIKSFYCALKFFGPMYYAKSEYVLYLDSDVLFFKKPGEILQRMESRTPFYMSDYHDAYSYPVEFLQKLLDVEVGHAINAGLFYCSRKDFADNMYLAETYFRKTSELAHKKVPLNRHEQTLAAVFLSKANAVRLGGEYQISRKQVTNETVSHHFVNDGWRLNFYAAGLRWLKSAGFIEKMNGDALCRKEKLDERR